MRNRDALFPETINPTLTDSLKDYIDKCSEESGRSQNDLIRTWIDEVADGQIDVNELKKFCY